MRWSGIVPPLTSLIFRDFHKNSSLSRTDSMRQCARAARVSVLLALSGLVMTGCARSVHAAWRTGGAAAGQSPAVAAVPRLADRGPPGLDADNQHLHALLAQQQQQNQQMQSALQQSQRELAETRNQGGGGDTTISPGAASRHGPPRTAGRFRSSASRGPTSFRTAISSASVLKAGSSLVPAGPN